MKRSVLMIMDNLQLHQKRSKRILTINSILFQDIFFATIEVIYFLKVLHLSFSEFATITSISVIISMIAEIPTGMISDIIQTKRSRHISSPRPYYQHQTFRFILRIKEKSPMLLLNFIGNIINLSHVRILFLS